MVGDGMVTFGVRRVTDCRNLKSSTWIGFDVPHRRGDAHDRRREIDVACRAVKADRNAALGFDAGELLEEVDVKIGAAKFAVGDPAQTEILLQADDVANRGVFDVAQLAARRSRPLRARSRASSNAAGRRKLPT